MIVLPWLTTYNPSHLAHTLAYLLFGTNGLAHSQSLSEIWCFTSYWAQAVQLIWCQYPNWDIPTLYSYNQTQSLKLTELTRIILLLHVGNMWKEANFTTVSEEHATSMLLTLTLGAMVASSSEMLAIWSTFTQCWHPKPELKSKFTSLQKSLSEFKKMGTVHSQSQPQYTFRIAVGWHKIVQLKFMNVSQKLIFSIRV